MKPYYQVKRILKRGRLKYRRWQAARRWGWDAVQQAPAVLGTAMPKGGSHFIHQVLSGLANVGPFIRPGFPPVNRFEDNSHLSEDEILAEIERMGSGEIRYGYIPCLEPYLSILKKPDRATVYIYRDPRDLVVSHVFYATYMHEGHGMHDHYTDELDSMEARLNVAIEGSDQPGLRLPSVWDRYSNYLAWIEEPGVHSVRFEDLIENRDEALSGILDYLEGFNVHLPFPRPISIAGMKKAIQPKKSGTYRKGKPGNWQDHFTPENKAKFKAVARDLLTRLDYEDDDEDW